MEVRLLVRSEDLVESPCEIVREFDNYVNIRMCSEVKIYIR